MTSMVGNMAAERLKAFVVLARHDDELKSAIKSANSPADIVALGAETGHEFSVEELSSTNLELAADDLKKITVRRAGFRVHPFGAKHWFGWK